MLFVAAGPSHAQICNYALSLHAGNVNGYSVLELKVHLQPTQTCSDFLVSCLRECFQILCSQRAYIADDAGGTWPWHL